MGRNAKARRENKIYPQQPAEGSSEQQTPKAEKKESTSDKSTGLKWTDEQINDFKAKVTEILDATNCSVGIRKQDRQKDSADERVELRKNMQSELEGLSSREEISSYIKKFDDEIFRQVGILAYGMQNLFGRSAAITGKSYTQAAILKIKMYFKEIDRADYASRTDVDAEPESPESPQQASRASFKR